MARRRRGKNAGAPHAAAGAATNREPRQAEPALARVGKALKSIGDSLTALGLIGSVLLFFVVWWAFGISPIAVVLQHAKDLSEPSRRSEEVEQFIREGDGAFDIGRYDASKQAYQEALKIEPANVIATRGIAKAEMMSGTYDAGLWRQRVEQMLKEAPEDPQAMTLLGNLLADTDPSAARVQFEQAIAKRPQLALAHFGLGVLDHKAGRLEEARTHFTEAVRLAPDNIEFLDSLAAIRVQKGDLAEALNDYDRLLKLDGNAALVWLEAAAVMRRMGNLNQAVQALASANTLLSDAKTAQLPVNVSSWYFTVTDPPTNLEDLDQKHAYAWLSLAATYDLLGKADEAKSYVDKMGTLHVLDSEAVRGLVNAEMEQVSVEQPSLRQRAVRFRDRVLNPPRSTEP